jgi:hypothetical protein
MHDTVERQAAIIHLCAGPGADRTVARCLICACGCQTGPHCLPVTSCKPESTCLQGKLGRSIESYTKVGADLDQCERPGFLSHGAYASLRLFCQYDHTDPENGIKYKGTSGLDRLR